MTHAQTCDFISLEFCVTSVSSAYAVYRKSLSVTRKLRSKQKRASLAQKACMLAQAQPFPAQCSGCGNLRTSKDKVRVLGLRSLACSLLTLQHCPSESLLGSPVPNSFKLLHTTDVVLMAVVGELSQSSI